MQWPGCSLTPVLAGLAFSIVVIRAEEFDVPPVPVWHRSVTLITGAGYKDNLLLSHFEPEESPFVKTGLELFVTRLPMEGPQFQFAANAEDLRFLSGDSVEKEQLAFIQARVTQEIGTAWEASLALEYLYLDQVLDVSITETNLSALRVRAHQVQANPGLRRSFGEAGQVELTFPVARNVLSAPLDDYWEGGPKLAFTRAYSEKSEWTLGFSYIYRGYDTRPQTDADGAPVAETSLALHQQKIELAWNHYLDARNRWRVSTKVSSKLNQDNGSGYFDYLRLQGSEQLRFRARIWDVSAEGKVSRYDYAKQRVSLTERSARERTELGFNLRGEKQLAKWVRLFAEYEYEKILSNQTLEEYSVNVVNGGLTWEF